MDFVRNVDAPGSIQGFQELTVTVVRNMMSRTQCRT